MTKKADANGSKEIAIREKTDIDGLIERAIDKSVPVETMERLLAMRRELRAERAKEDFDRALAEFQKRCPIINKTKAVKNKDGTSRYSYAPLEEIVRQTKEIISDCGLSYTIQTENTETMLVSIVNVRHISGHSETTRFAVPIDKSAFMNNQQQYASASSFSKRYAFCNAFGILTGDDDDDAISASVPKQDESKIPQPKTTSKAEMPKAEAKSKPIENVSSVKEVVDAEVGTQFEIVRAGIIDIKQRTNATGKVITDYYVCDTIDGFNSMITAWGEPTAKVGDEANFLGVKIVDYKGVKRNSCDKVVGLVKTEPKLDYKGF